MARGQGVFASLGVRGSIGDTFTFCSWKGIQVIKKKPFPSNPRTTDQQAERSNFSNGVVQWHNQKLEAADKQAWDLRALLDSKPLSGFNMFMSRWRANNGVATDILLYNINFQASGLQVSPRITADANCDVTFFIVRGPNAGYSETQTVAADVEEAYSAIDVNANDVCLFRVDPPAFFGESGFHRAVVD